MKFLRKFSSHFGWYFRFTNYLQHATSRHKFWIINVCCGRAVVLRTALFGFEPRWLPKRYQKSLAPYYRLRLPSCVRGFESQAHNLCFFNLYYWNCNEKRSKINKKDRDWTIFLKKSPLVHQSLTIVNYDSRIALTRKFPRYITILWL